MKTKLFLLILSLFLISGATAQVKMNRTSEEPASMAKSKSFINRHGLAMAVKYGAKVGVNLSNMNSNMTFDPEFSMGTGFQVGGFVNLHWGQRTASSLPGTGLWGVQPEVLFSSQKVKSVGGDITMNYIKVPVMLKVYPLSALSFEVGPEFSYLLSVSPSSVKVDGATVAVGDCKGFDFGLGVGAAYELEFGLVIGARYSFGTKDLGENLKWKNNSNIQITAGWLF